MLHTTDGGKNWTLIESETTENLTGICFLDKTTAIAVGSHGTIIRSINGGLRWDCTDSKVKNNIRGVSFKEKIGTAVGESGLILHSLDGGITWKNESLVDGPHLLAVSQLDAKRAVAVGLVGAIYTREEK